MTTATAVDYLEMRIAKVVGLTAADNELRQSVVLEEVTGDRQVAIEIGQAEAFSLAARLVSSHDLPVRRYLGASPWRASAGRGSTSAQTRSATCGWTGCSEPDALPPSRARSGVGR
jgi:hypothetical protein